MSFQALAVGAHVLIVLGFSLRILLREHLQPAARLAWFLVILALPYVGGLLYFLFGEIDIGNHQARAHAEAWAELAERAGPAFGEASALEALPGCLRPALSFAASINGLNPLGGNQARLTADGADTARQLVADIDAAEESVHALYYIWLEDGMGTALAEALIRAAGRGVRCRALADGLGSRALIGGPLWRRMAEAGVELGVALPLDRPLRTLLKSRVDLRNHRKITVIDDAITYCGSRNSADPEFLPKAKYAPWVDIMLRLTGPIAAQNQLIFAADWLVATGQRLELRTPPPAEGGFFAQAIGDGPTIRRAATPQLFATVIACAQASLRISTPYFVPDATVLNALEAAAYRGVRLQLIFPARNDSWVVAAVSRSYYRQLLKAGAEIYEFEGGLLHAKTLTLDGRLSVIGSTNLDLRSFELNYENDVLLVDEATTAAICARQAEYMASARQIGLQEVEAWPLSRRLKNHVLATIGPVL